MFWTLLVLLILLVYIFLLRPWMLRWGTSDEEARQLLPGDELLEKPQIKVTQAVTINAPPEQVWPWIVQLGYQRAGWYNLDFMNRILGAAKFVEGHHSASRIVPELQDLKLGDKIFMAREMGLTVKEISPLRSLVLFMGDERIWGFSWVYDLKPVGEGSTRLVIRYRIQHLKTLVAWLFFHVFEPGVFLQEWAHITGIKKRAEGC